MRLNRVEKVEGFREDGMKAITDNPEYFLWWYTVKSVGLGVVGAFAAFMVGRELMRSNRVRRGRRIRAAVRGA